MHFTKRKKKILAGIIMAALLVAAWSNAGHVIVANKGENVLAASLPSPTPVMPGYLNVAGIPVTSGAISVSDTLSIDKVDFVERTATSVTISWSCDALQNGVYYIYQYNEKTEKYDYIAGSKETTYVCKKLDSARRYYFTVCAFDEANMVQGACAAAVETYTKPKKVQNVTFTSNKKNKIKVKWKAVSGADGYTIYHAKGSGAFEEVGRTTGKTFLDEGLLSGQTYRYRVRAYAFYEDNIGSFSDIVKTTTLPETPVIKSIKGGDKKARITWGAVTGAAGYYLYWHDGTEYQLLKTLEGKKSTQYIHTGLKNGVNSKYKVKAYRILNDTEYKSGASAVKKAAVSKQVTVTAPTLFATKEQFKKSGAYLLNKDFQKAVDYGKSYVIPGVKGTDVDGFYSKNMCPQGLTFAGSYLLLSSYDQKNEENSVIYVMKKSNRKLVMTIVLPNKTHAGGIAYDGSNIWVTQTNTVRSISFSDIKNAINEGKKEYLASYKTVCQLTHQAATVTYYKSKLWVASYDELVSGYLGVYSISKKSSSPELKMVALTRVPTKVQGLEFVNDGKLILSRSCQMNAAQRGFWHTLDIYQPDISKVSSGSITLGDVKKTVEMPTMNEEIAIDGNYLYVNFESAAFSTAVQPMDRVCALKTSIITSIKKEKTLKKSSSKKKEKPEESKEPEEKIEKFEEMELFGDLLDITE